MPNDDFNGCRACMNCSRRNDMYARDGKTWCDLWHTKVDEFDVCKNFKEENYES